MHLILLICSLALSSSLIAGTDYSLTSVPHSEIDSYLTIGSEASGTPENLRGLFWMDGNPLPDEVVSFAGAHFSPILKKGDIVGYEAWIPVYDEGIWSWHDTLSGRLLYAAVRRVNLRYHLIFNIDFTRGKVIPVVRPLPHTPGLEIPQSMLLAFDMVMVNRDEWRRDSRIAGLPHCYRFRRIVDGDGNRLANFEDYEDSIRARGLSNALVPVCNDNSRFKLPTACARN